MLVSNIGITEEAAFSELRADVLCDTHWVWGDDPFPLSYRFPKNCDNFLKTDNGDPFVAACLLPAMALGESLTIEGYVSPKLFNSISAIQSIYRCWDRQLSEVDVHAILRDVPAPTSDRERRIGLFFSMGVDSTYSLWKNVSQQSCPDQLITDLIVVEGFDVYLWESHRFPPMLASIENVASQLDKKVLPVTTNLREFSDRMADWVRFYHGPALASIALSLGNMFSAVHIAAAQTYARLIPRGAHPLLDPLWGTESVGFSHDGLEAGRLDKILSIAECKALVQELRVCTTSEVTDAYNCGKCEKCVRTMIALHIAGALTQCDSLPHKIDPEVVRNLAVRNLTAITTLQQLAEELGSTDDDMQLKHAVEECISRHEDSLH